MARSTQHYQAGINQVLAEGADAASPSPETSPLRSDTHGSAETDGTNREAVTALVQGIIDLLGKQNKEHGPTDYDQRLVEKTKGPKHFRAFDERIYQLGLKLQSLANAVRQSGSSLDLLEAIRNVRNRLDRIQYLFRGNAAKLFEDIVDNHGTIPHAGRNKGSRPGSLTTSAESIEMLPVEMELLAEELHQFLDCLYNMFGFLDETMDAIEGLARDLKYRAFCLKDFKGQLGFNTVAYHINNLTEDLSEHIDRMTDSLGSFINAGALFIQKQNSASLQNLSTVAALLSGVTATTLQFSYTFHGKPLFDWVNGLWISSLVFSIASAINSQFAYRWRSARYRSPRKRPWWVTVWIARTPWIFLVGSVMAFSAGLCLFTYTSQQPTAVRIATITFAAITAFALICVEVWFTAEYRYWSDLKRETEHWLCEFREDVTTPLIRTFAPSDPNRDHEANPTHDDPTSPITPTSPGPQNPVTSLTTTSRTQPNTNPAPQGHITFRVLTGVIMRLRGLTSRRHEPAQPMLPVFSPPREQRRDSTGDQLDSGQTQIRIAMLDALRSTQLPSEHTAPAGHLQFSPDGQFLATSSRDAAVLIWNVGSELSDRFKVSRRLWHELIRGDSVEQVAWSPKGGQLLTKQTKKVKMWDVETEQFKEFDRSRHVQSIAWLPGGSGFVSVEWQVDKTLSPSEKRTHRGEHIVGTDLFILRQPPPSSDQPELQNGSQDVDQAVGTPLSLPGLQVWDVAVMPGEERLVAVATLVTDLKPAKSRSEKRILSEYDQCAKAAATEKGGVVYNLTKGIIEDQVPLLQEVRDVTLTEQGKYALVSYKNWAPPQVWRINAIVGKGICTLMLTHTYYPKNSVDFTGRSYFGGTNDAFVLCASKGGGIHIWERASGRLLRSLRIPDQLTHITSNHQSEDKFMFASAARDGKVRIWTSRNPPTHGRTQSFEPMEVQSSISEPSEIVQSGSSRSGIHRAMSAPGAS